MNMANFGTPYVQPSRIAQLESLASLGALISFLMFILKMMRLAERE
jgi:hypothetical protein